MDIYSFLNSRDIAAHCKEIGKVWTPFEMAVIIGMSHRSMPEKHAAWRNLISDYPDMPTPGNKNMRQDSCDSLHKKISDHLIYEERIVENFKTPDPTAVYVSMASEKNYLGVYSSFDKALKSAQERFDRNSVDLWGIAKQFIDDDVDLTFWLDYDGIPFKFNQWGENGEISWDFLESVYFDRQFFVDIPAPFRKGDILVCRSNPEELVVLDSLIIDDREKLDRLKPDLNGNDLTGRGICAHPDGLRGSDIFNYDEWEYYRGELKGINRLLEYASLYLRGEITVIDLIAMQKKFLLENIFLNEICPDNDANRI